MRRRLVVAKTEALYASERQSVAITRELYRKFDTFCRVTCKYEPTLTATWGIWLGKHHAKQEVAIEKFKEDAALRGKASKDRKLRASSVAPLCEVVQQLNKASETMTLFHCIELRKVRWVQP